MDIFSYNSFIRLSFLKLLAYRFRYFTGVITYLLFVSVHFFIWNAIFEGRDESQTINGYSLKELITYISVGWIARSLYFSNLDEEIAQLVKTGQISFYLLKPVHFHLMMIFEAFGGLLFRFFLFTIPISLVLMFFFPISLPYSLLHGITFIFATFVSFIVFAEINFLLGLLCFATKSIEGITRAKYFFIQLFSGLLLPISFFPDWIRGYVEFLPFRLIAATPLDIYLGKYSGYDLVSVLFDMMIWVFVLVSLSEIFWKMAFKQLSIQGG